MKQTGSSAEVVTQEQLKELLEYQPESGEFVWLAAKSRRVKVGAKAGSLRRVNGYTTIRIDGQRYRSHRLVWLYSYGVFPEKDIDHVNGNRNNNCLENLREVSRSENSRNVRMKSNNTSGFTGASLVEKKRENGKIDKYWLTTWVDISGRYKQKLFQISMYGDAQAKELAIALRESKIQELNNLGLGYTQRHGN